jgi:hypothetical protein
MPGWLSGALQNQTVTALIGVALGAVLGFFGSVSLLAVESRRDHRAAVRAILVELSNNWATLETARRGGLAADHVALDTSAYDSLLLQLYTRLPNKVAVPVAVAYGRLHMFRGKPILLATENPDQIYVGATALWTYAASLGLEFDPLEKP